MKKLISLLICIVAIYIVTTPKDLGAQALRVLLPVQGGTGISTSSPTDVGKCIKVLSDSPFKYELASCGGLGSDPTIIQVDGTPQSVGTPTLNFTGNSFSLTESPADTFSLRVSTSTLGLLASSISDFVSTVRTSISETIEGLTYTSGTGVLSLDSGYTIPTTTRATNWDTAFSWGNHASQGYITDGNTLFSNVGLYTPTSPLRPNQSETIITTFQTGHGFTNSGGTGTSSDDTSIYTVGTSSLKLQTDAIGSTMIVQKTSISPKIDVRNKNIKIVVRIATTSDISLTYPSRFWIAISSDNFNGYRYCEFMPDLYFEPSGGTWMTITCSLADLQRSDTLDLSQINAIRIYARATNVTSATFWINKISLVPVTKTPIITFSFDDGNSTDYSLAMPKLSQYGYPATTYIIPEGVGTGGYVTLAQLKELKENHGWQVASHDSINYSTYTNQTDLEKRILYIKNWFLQNGLSGGIDDIAYPNGAINSSIVLPVIKKYFRSGRLDDTTGLGKVETIPYGNQYKLHSYMVNANNPVATVKAEIDAAVANNAWIILGFHNLNNSPSGPDYTPDNFNQIVDYIYTTYTSQNKAIVRTVADVLNNEYQDNFTEINQLNNNIGIGSTSPSSRLTVSGNGYFGGNLIATGTLLAPIHYGGSAVSSILALRSTSGVGTSDAITFGVGNNGGTEAMRILNSGKINIGTTTATATLSVAVASSSAGMPQATPWGFLLNMVISGVSYVVQTWDYFGHQYLSGPIPTLSSCGTSPTITGNDNAGTITVGTTATGCTVTFARAWTSAPVCTISNQNMSITSTLGYTISTTALTFSQATGFSSNVVNYICVGTRP